MPDEKQMYAHVFLTDGTHLTFTKVGRAEDVVDGKPSEVLSETPFGFTYRANRRTVVMLPWHRVSEVHITK